MGGRWWIGVVGLVALQACGPIQATTEISRATEEYRTARIMGADTLAPYEFTKAELFLNKAKERQGFSDFEASKTFAAESMRYSMEAKRNAPKNLKTKEVRDKAAANVPSLDVQNQGGAK